MLETYFFIPADKQKYIDKMSALDADYFVLDLEESVSEQNKELAFSNIKELAIEENYFCRMPIDELPEERITELVSRFEGRIIIPKARTLDDVASFIDAKSARTLKLILLVEHPRTIVELPDLLRRYSSSMWGIGFGSHDFCSVMNMEHSTSHLSAYRKQLILLAKAFEIRYIDGVDLNIRDHSTLKEECLFAYESGADGKFAIHPSQLDSIYDVEYLSADEIAELHAVNSKLSDIPIDTMDVVEIDGKVYEKPHISQIKKTIARLDRRSKAMT